MRAPPWGRCSSPSAPEPLPGGSGVAQLSSGRHRMAKPARVLYCHTRRTEKRGATVPGTVFANTRGIAHKGSSGMSTIFPDVCKTPTPAGPVPIPYPNIGQSSKSSGDEAGSAGGVMSGKIKGPCEFMLYSFDVQFEGKNVCRLGDQLFHNDKNGMG